MNSVLYSLLIGVLIGFAAGIVLAILIPPLLSLPSHPKVRLPGAKLYERWSHYWVEKSLEWERRQ